MTSDWSAYAQEQGFGRELGEVLVRAARASRSPYLTTGDLLQSLVRDTGHAGEACAALGLGPGRIERPLEELAVSPEPRSGHAPSLSAPASDVLFHTQDEGDMLGLQTSSALLLALRLDRRGLPSTPGVPTAPPGHGELVLEMMGIERSRLRMAVLEAIAQTNPDTRDWDTRCDTYLRLSRFHLACTDAQATGRGGGVSPSVREEAARLPATGPALPAILPRGFEVAKPCPLRRTEEVVRRAARPDDGVPASGAARAAALCGPLRAGCEPQPPLRGGGGSGRGQRLGLRAAPGVHAPGRRHREGGRHARALLVRAPRCGGRERGGPGPARGVPARDGPRRAAQRHLQPGGHRLVHDGPWPPKPDGRGAEARRLPSGRVHPAPGRLHPE
ncbi:hypothetical protein STIAU_3623 [Stigmatella aurantiaca DW4/3-1]|uniref:Uncharacterized protein n=1 Tax=Stigmatella aurantiaca (strain DW4/3-1) TaxID=378806 RepID=Q08NZ7_STIAD|nr:hypothetical protein STIAU_3623 [Stigmatella aurantiaca DW4/3-1]